MRDFKLTPETTVREIKAALEAEGYDTAAVRPEKVKEYYDKGGLYWSNHEILLVGETGVPVATYKRSKSVQDAESELQSNPVQTIYSEPNRPQGWERESI
jgi:hypothetical protein